MNARVGVNLAGEPGFRLGSVSVRPGLRELVHDDGRREVLEPRVMQVLTVLARAEGEIVTRDDLIAECWEGRIVGEDAINRVISRLHKLSSDIGAGAFRLETITKVGYRLLPGKAGSTAVSPPAPVGAKGASRRRLIAAGLVALALAGGGATILALRPKRRLDSATQALYDQGWAALGNMMPDQDAQAQALFSRVVALASDYADGWGALGYAYACRSTGVGPPVHEALVERASDAIRHARQLDRDNALASAADARLRPLYGDWLNAERAYLAALKAHPDFSPLLAVLAGALSSVGRTREAAATIERGQPEQGPSPYWVYQRISMMAAAGRIEDADRASADGLRLYPSNTSIWFGRFHFLVRTGRPDLAITMADNRSERPRGIPESDFQLVVDGARALITRAPADIERAMASNLAAAMTGSGYAENAMQLAVMLGRLNEAFAVLDVLYGPNRPAAAFSEQQGLYYPEPRTSFLFAPHLAALYLDPRFEALMARIGLTAYWRQSGRPPDYKASA